MNGRLPTKGSTRIVQMTQGLFALTVLLFLLCLIPIGLYAVGGSPFPHHLPSWPDIAARLAQPDTDNTLFLTCVRLIGWGAWAIFAATTTSEAICLVRGRSPRRLPPPIRLFQHLARGLIATAALIVTTAGPITHATAAAGHQQPALFSGPSDAPRSASTNDVRSLRQGWILTAESTTTVANQTQHPNQRAWRTYTVKRGDTLWAIARHTYGSGTRYRTIFTASKHLTQPAPLPPITNPNQIFPGQHLKIPENGVNSSQPPAAPPRPKPPSATPLPTTPSMPAITPPNPASRPPAPPMASPPRRTTPSSPPARVPTPPTPHPTGTSRSTGTPRPPTTAQSPTPPASAGQAPTSTPSPPAQHRDAPATVMLRTGGFVSLGLATIISIALAATRLHRRRRRTHQEWPPAPEPEPAPPDPVAHVRKAHLDALTDEGKPLPSDEELVGSDFTTPPPTQLTVGVRGQAEVVVDLAGLNLALTGPGALSVVRAITAELLARSRRSRVELLLPEPDVAALLGGTGITGDQPTDTVPGLTITSSLNTAITHLEAEFIHRARLMETLDIPDVPALRATEPGEPLPALVLIATTPDQPTHALVCRVRSSVG